MNRITLPVAFPKPGLWLAACLVLQLLLARYGVEPSTELLAWLWIGTMWAGWSGCLWLASAIGKPWIRILVIILAGVWHAVWMSVGREQPLLRYLLMFGGYGVTQSILFRFVRVPQWRLNPLRLEPNDQVRRQFAILELLLLMTAVALLITGGKRYEPPSGQSFWIGLPFVYVAITATATLAALLFMAPSKLHRRLFALGIVAAVTIGSITIAWLDIQLSPQPSMMPFNWVPYYGIQGSFAILIVLLAACGKTSTTTPLDTTMAEEFLPEIKTSDLLRSTADESPSSDDLLPFRQPPHT